ncbi:MULTISPECIES: DUF4124 domain-containing protein [unclassified Undibacterium]|uniref:DUF4124 domain-containing protein n=1 Tax=unclassified Undibacterium TaxID=2630295 RepID=UPI002AC9A4ED|nr:MULTISPECIES: DUF4124 domain-containing protein [unclassified Undibacterium]MEB0139051.1 DUF4124 domain-containing protein [Undibacterium sp. CCC2.1]MEB0172992.1 DUF4124 domain-containing protein [Undibacterium sp. CCC1.1]MEB0177957.1 DUF4124 domain-containing protein [Undibacterium sp. CCC3.4]MEB0215910.1 DUF4124 domain-containing protein [Undibacterium sp. 5I2]WPX42111.1 DUF4124 domain-containing protein [Undibacterium sp. CCC3.4]
MKRLLTGIIVLLTMEGIAHAQTEVFLCVDDTGKKEYKNTGTTKGCRRIDLPGITVVPAPPPIKKSQAKSASSPADFPKVDEGTQKARDSDRKQILQDELKAEQLKLTGLKKDYNNGEPERLGSERNFAKYQERTIMMKDNVSRTEKNVEALQRELNNLK